MTPDTAGSKHSKQPSMPPQSRQVLEKQVPPNHLRASLKPQPMPPLYRSPEDRRELNFRNSNISGVLDSGSMKSFTHLKMPIKKNA